jgi:hypothetical protein
MAMAKNKKFYSVGGVNEPASKTNGYILRWIDEENEVLQKGPFTSIEKALTEQNTN